MSQDFNRLTLRIFQGCPFGMGKAGFIRTGILNIVCFGTADNIFLLFNRQLTPALQIMLVTLQVNITAAGKGSVSDHSNRSPVIS